MSTWTMNGIVFPESETRGKTKPSLSKRMKVLVEKQRRRVLVYQNENYSHGKEIIANTFEEVWQQIIAVKRLRVRVLFS